MTSKKAGPILVVSPAFDGDANMRLDRELLDRAGRGVAAARLYQWAEPCVSLGRFQVPQRDLLRDDFPWTMRPTGGKAVLHGHDLTVSIGCPLELSGRSRPRLGDLYRLLVSPVRRALHTVGVEVELGGRTAPGGPSSDCFADIASYDLVANGEKICGCAMRVTRSAALLQASIPFREPTVLASAVIAGGKDLPVKSWNWEAFEMAFRDELEGWTIPKDLPSKF